MTLLQIRLAIYAVIALIVVGAYYSWENHIEAVQHEKDMAAVERTTKELLQRKMVEVKIENDALQERKDNAIQIYAKHSADIERDASNLTDRLSKRPGSCRNTVPGKVEDDSRTESRNLEKDRSVAVEIVSVLNSCEFWINQIPVK